MLKDQKEPASIASKRVTCLGNAQQRELLMVEAVVVEETEMKDLIEMIEMTEMTTGMIGMREMRIEVVLGMTTDRRVRLKKVNHNGGHQAMIMPYQSHQ